MILAAHVIVTAYGFWLPNDPRGSWSDFVRSWELQRFGPATKVESRRSVAHRPYDKRLRYEMRDSLAREPVSFNGRQALAVAHGFANEAQHSGLLIHACAILPEHFHLVVSRHHYDFTKVVNRLKGSAIRSLNKAGLHPFVDQAYQDGTIPTPWTRKWWIVYLNTPADLDRATKYVVNNPVREGKPVQRWKFVVPPDD